MLIREACVETFREAVNAQELGAERIELCARLDLGGITPSYALIESVKKTLRIPVMVMVRPRGGNFSYNQMELKIMRQNIETCKMIGITGIVFGFLQESGIVDHSLTEEFARLAYPLDITFHKAIDETPDPVAAIEVLKEVEGITRVLSSGGAETAMAGAGVLNSMISKAGNRIIIMPGGKVTRDNLHEVAGIIKTHEFHGKKIVGPLNG
ncbi:MAG: copper homeostasis protein CutC [Cyclobacteriaceae bacterium]|nr:copper homeostasis protein CutC [Cyclobacteriaceae bacterium]